MNPAEKAIEQEATGGCQVEVMGSQRVCALQALGALALLTGLVLLGDDGAGTARSVLNVAVAAMSAFVAAKLIRVLLRLRHDPVLLCATEHHLVALDANRWCRTRVTQRSQVARVELLTFWFGRRGSLMRIHLRDERPISILPLAASGLADYVPSIATWIDDSDKTSD